MTQARTISVVIPFYDGGATIQRAIDSIEAQTRRPAEIVVVDDGSPTSLPELRSTLPLVVASHPTNRGIPAARNTGIAAATGEWIGFLDQDDEWEPTKLERQVARMEAHEGRAIVFGTLRHEGPGVRAWDWPPARAIRRIRAGGDRAMAALVHWGNAAPFVTLLLPRVVFERVGPLDESLRGGSDDYEYVIRAVAEGVPLVHDGGAYSAVHHFTGRNYSAHAPRWLEDNFQLIERLAERYPLVAAWRARALARVEYTYGRHHDRTGESAAARERYIEAARLDPRWWKPRAARMWLRLPRRVRAWVERRMK